jgi:VWFA-related protein
MLRTASALAIGLAGLLGAAEGDVVFRSDVSLVRVDAQVIDRSNRAITGLRAEDFIVREQGQPQQIRNFSSESMPVDIVLLLDVSASMRPHVERVASAAHQALRVLGDQDRVAIMVFDRATRLRLPFRNSREEVAQELESLLDQEMFNGGTDITRGLLDAARYVEREARHDARRAIVILTDDQTERNRDEEGVERALTRADAVLCALLAPDAMMSRRGTGGYPRGGGGGSWPGGGGGGGIGGPLGGIILGRRGPYGGRGGGGGGGPVTIGSHTSSAGTAEIARASGGDSMRVDDASALETTLERIRQRYALYFYLPNGVKPGEERGIEVALSDAARRRYSDADVRYRRVYLAPGGGTEAVHSTSSASDGAEQTSTDQPRLRRRRPAVDQPDGSQSGPVMSTEPQGGWRKVDETAPAAPAAQPAAASSSSADPDCHWRRADEPEKPACAVNPDPVRPANPGKRR